MFQLFLFSMLLNIGNIPDTIKTLSTVFLNSAQSSKKMTVIGNTAPIFTATSSFSIDQNKKSDTNYAFILNLIKSRKDNYDIKQFDIFFTNDNNIDSIMIVFDFIQYKKEVTYSSLTKEKRIYTDSLVIIRPSKGWYPIDLKNLNVPKDKDLLLQIGVKNIKYIDKNKLSKFFSISLWGNCPTFFTNQDTIVKMPFSLKFAFKLHIVETLTIKRK